MIRTLVYIWAVIVVVGVSLITRKPQETEGATSGEGQNMMTAETDSNDRNKKHVNDSSNGDATPMTNEATGLVSKEPEQIRGVKYCFYSIRTWQFFALMILSNIFGTFFSYSYKVYGENKEPHPPISDKLLTWAASVGSGLVNGLSRIVLGAIVDRVGFKTLFAILMVI